MKVCLTDEPKRAGWLFTDVWFQHRQFINMGTLVKSIRWTQ